MMLVDTSIWVDHLRASSPELIELLDAREVLIHRFIIGEIALGSLQQRRAILASLARLPRVVDAVDDEVFDLIENKALFGLGIGFVDAHLLASLRLTPSTTLWTGDKRLVNAANFAGVPTRKHH